MQQIKLFKVIRCYLDQDVYELLALVLAFVVLFSPLDLDDAFFDDEFDSLCDVGTLAPSAFFGNNIYKKKSLKFSFKVIL
jgi:hypothetical protein